MLSRTLRQAATTSRRLSQQPTVRRLASTSSSEAPAQGSSNFTKALRTVALTASIGCSAYTLGSLYPPTFATYITPRIAPPPPDPEHPSSIAYIEDLEAQLQNLPLLAYFRNHADASDWYETRPFIAVPKEELANSLTAGSLRGPGKLALPPLVRARKDESEAVVIVHVGTALCGHEGIVHGGLLATLLDESLGRIVRSPHFVQKDNKLAHAPSLVPLELAGQNWRHSLPEPQLSRTDES